MTKSPFKIYIDRLSEGDSEKISETAPPSFLEIQEEELHFTGMITLLGQAYLAKDSLIITLKIKATAQMPCSICNEKIEVPIAIDDFAITEELSDLKSSIYDYTDELRTAILIKVPQFVECHHGHCPHRKVVNNFLKTTDPNTHSPFSELNL